MGALTWIICKYSTELYLILKQECILLLWPFQGRIQGEGAPGSFPPPPLKLEKIWFFGVKSWFFTRNTPKMFTPPSATFFKCAPLTWNPGSAPVVHVYCWQRHLNAHNQSYICILFPKFHLLKHLTFLHFTNS